MNTGARRNLIRLLIPVLAVVAAAGQTQSKPAKATRPLTPDQIAVYHAFLKHYMSKQLGIKMVLNIAKTTTPFKANSSDLKNGCLEGFTSLPSANVVHTFTSQFADMPDVRLVNSATHKFADPGNAIRQGVSVNQAVMAGFAAGLFTFSEVVFDPTHHYAAVGYSFECGLLCGDGGTEVFKFNHGAWERTHRFCSWWES